MSTMSFTPEQLQEIAYEELHPSDNIAYQIIVSNVVMGIIAVLAVAARITSRRLAKVAFAIDDYLVFFALICFLAYIGTSSRTIAYGNGKHLIYVTDAYGLGWSFLVSECLYNVLIPTLKLSLLFLYNRLFPQKWFKRCLVLTAIFVLAYSTAFFFVDLFQCVPISKSWDPTEAGTCIQYWVVVLLGSVVNALSDFVILILPIPVIWKLKLKKNKRNQLLVIFTIGGLGCLASIVRLGYCYQIATFDRSYNVVPLIVCTTVEMGMAFLAACTPTYSAIINYFTGSLTTKPSKAYYSHDKNSRSNVISSSNNQGSKTYTREITREARDSDDMELIRQGGHVNTVISTFNDQETIS